MTGLRTQESDKFLNFFGIVQKKAETQNSVFFLDTAEGHERFTKDMECTDLSGWLIPVALASEFEKGYKDFDESDSWDDKWLEYYQFAIWRDIDSDIAVDFKKF